MASAVESAQSLSIFDPASPSAESIRKLSVLVLAITGFIFVVVEGILFYSIFRFRVGARSGERAPTDDRATAGDPGAAGDRATAGDPGTAGDRAATGAGTMEPPQVYGSKPIEIAWTAAPALIVFILVLVTARTLWEVNVPPPQPRA